MAFTTHLSILDGLRKNDENAWGRFFREYQPLLRLHGRDCGVPEAQLDDLGQEVLLVLTRGSAAEFDGSRGRFRCFLRGIIRNKAHELRRKLYREAMLETELQDTLLYDEAWEDVQAQEWTSHAFACTMKLLRHLLPPLHFQVFELLTVQSWKPRKVAAFLGMPLPTVYSIQNRTMAKLKRMRPLLEEKCR